MSGFNLLKWLYNHSPVNFYSVTAEGETIIKSINNTFTGYKFSSEFSKDIIENLRKTIKNFKRYWLLIFFIVYAVIVYFVVFPNYTLISDSTLNLFILLVVLFLIIYIMAIINSKLFEFYLRKNFGEFEKVHFPASNSIENQSYREFKIELVKIFALFLFLIGAYLCIGSPYKTSTQLIANQKYDEAIKLTTVWSKIFPINSKWYSLRGYSRFKMQDYKGAIDDYERAYELENDDYKTMNFDNKIFIKYYIKDYKSALEDFDKEIKSGKDIYEQDPFLWDKAQFLYNIGKYKESLAIYNLLIENSDSDLLYLIQNRLYYERGLVNQKMNKIKEANADFAKADELYLEESFKQDIPKPKLLFENFKEELP